MCKVTIFTDGSCLGNPGSGGWAAILKYTELQKDKIIPEERILSGGYRLTTNNRMELMAAIKGLQKVLEITRIKKIEIVSDSQYLCNAFEQGWIKNWKKQGWRRKNNGLIANADLWQTLDTLIEGNKFNIKFTWVRGHNGHPLNEKCDFLANREAGKHNLPMDQGYENTETAVQSSLMPENSNPGEVHFLTEMGLFANMPDKETSRIYLASPYSFPDMQVCKMRYEAVCRVAGQMIGNGFQVFSPIAHSHPIAVNHSLPGDFQYWRKWCLSFLDNWATHFVILTLDGWKQSKGIQAELIYAMSKDLEVLSIRP